MTTQQENYIESRLEAYREELQDKAADWIQDEVDKVLEDQEIAEAERASEDLHLHGAAYETHMKKSLKIQKRKCMSISKE